MIIPFFNNIMKLIDVCNKDNHKVNYINCQHKECKIQLENWQEKRQSKNIDRQRVFILFYFEHQYLALQ